LDRTNKETSVNYFTTKAPMQDMQTGAQRALDRRRTKRLPLRTRALVGIPGQSAIRGQIVEVSTDGLSVALPIAPDIGSVCTLFFTLMFEGRLIALSGPGKVTHCTCTSSEGFRVGMTFHPQDPQAQEALHKLLGRAASVAE
jgi:hypothetical protein